MRLCRLVANSRLGCVPAAHDELAAFESDPALAQYYLLPAVKGRLLADLGKYADAAACYRRALDLPCSEPERRFLTRRLGDALAHA